jgi:GcrA cell cycle regulator
MGSNKNTHWTEERVEQLKKLRDDGLSAAQIVAELGGVTRNGVLGKVHRLGLASRAGEIKTGRPTGIARQRETHPRPSQTKIQPCGAGWRIRDAAPTLIEIAEGSNPPVHAVNFQDLLDGDCRWPYGDCPDMMFCGAAKLGKLPYCASHARMAYHQPLRGVAA